MDRKKISVQVGDKTLSFETGKIARQANGAVLVHCGDTVVLGTACASAAPTPGIDFFPLRVDYQEKYSSVGRTAGGFLKREGRPSEREILVCRLIDRPLRPMFVEGYYNEVQILSYVFSYDGANSPDILAINAASAALVISDIPLVKPIGGVRVGHVHGKFVINPTVEEMKSSRLDLVLAGTEDAILMIEGHCDYLTEDEVLKAIETGHQAIQTICHALAKWQKEIGKEKKQDALRLIPEEVTRLVKEHCEARLKAGLHLPTKQEREQALADTNAHLIATLFPEGAAPKYEKGMVQLAYKNLQSHLMRLVVLNEGKRLDGRGLKDIRKIDIEQSVLPRTHGSSLFTRGETQAIAVCTLGSEDSAQRYEDLHGEGTQRFYLQYFFPPFSVGEVGRIGSPGRREVGHGKLAERSLKATLPSQEAFPYVIRLESNITESNGSSSMASVCGGCLALMDAGVPIKRPVAGIAMGLVLEHNKYAILSDILGSEDALGDMDFKVAGDHDGITAFQMDIKVEGITFKIMEEALRQAKEGRSYILNKMLAVCPTPKNEMSRYAPRIEVIQIKPSKIGTVIGPGGKQIRAIVEETGVEINIDDNGLVSLSSQSAEGMKRAREIVLGLTTDVEIGKTYTGRITSVKEFGFFVEVLPGKEGLCHISEISHKRLATVQDAPFKEGDTIVVKVLDINDRGQVRLSHKATLEQMAHT